MAASSCDGTWHSGTISGALFESGQPAPVPAFLWQMLAQLGMPGLVIRATNSDMFAPETLVKVRNSNARLTTIELPGSHDLAGDNAAGLVAAVQRFLEAQVTDTPSSSATH